jgi:hypothetical protein
MHDEVTPAGFDFVQQLNTVLDLAIPWFSSVLRTQRQNHPCYWFLLSWFSFSIVSSVSGWFAAGRSTVGHCCSFL